MKYLRQFSVILSISFLGELLEYLIPLPVSAGIYGLVLLLAGLVTKIIPLKAVEGAADFLVEIMPVLFFLSNHFVSIIRLLNVIGAFNDISHFL